MFDDGASLCVQFFTTVNCQYINFTVFTATRTSKVKNCASLVYDNSHAQLKSQFCHLLLDKTRAQKRSQENLRKDVF